MSTHIEAVLIRVPTLAACAALAACDTGLHEDPSPRAEPFHETSRSVLAVDSAAATLIGDAPDDVFGSALAGGCDIDGDGRGDLIVTAQFGHSLGPIDPTLDAIERPGRWYAFASALPAGAMQASAVASTMVAMAEPNENPVTLACTDEFIVVGSQHSSIGSKLEGSARVYATSDLRPRMYAGESIGAVRGDIAGVHGSRGGVALGEYDGDGSMDMVFPTPLRVVPNEPGSVYLISDITGGVLALNPSAPSVAERVVRGNQIGDYLGHSVVNVGDVNGDGRDDLALGATGEHSEGWFSGAVYILHGPMELGTRPVDTVADWALYGDSKDSAGYAVAGIADSDGDGYDDFAVGVPGHDSPVCGEESGGVFLMAGRAVGHGGMFSDEARSSMCVGAVGGSKFGHSVALAGDVNGDGAEDLLVGAHLASMEGAGSGAAYVVAGPVPPGRHAVETLDGATILGLRPYGLFGEVVVGVGDRDGDGRADIAISEPNAPTAGAVHVFRGAALSW